MTSIANEQNLDTVLDTRTTKNDVEMSRYVRQLMADVEALPVFRPVIGCVVPAYNEAESIEAVLRSLLKQSRLPDQIHVVVNNTVDDTFGLAARFAGVRRGRKTGKGVRRQ